MRQALNIIISVFVKPEENEENNQKCIDAIAYLSGINLEKEKLTVAKEVVEGFENRKIRIYTLKLTKESHTNTCIENIFSKFDKTQISMLDEQKESRLDEEMNFYMRLEKEHLFNSIFSLTNSGECFHIKINLAAFPKKKQSAIKLLEEIFDKYLNRQDRDLNIQDRN